MALDAYRKKRNFKKTSEPNSSGGLQHPYLFVVQKHAASHLHYDFRLELNGVLKSWAVPKGPCLDPSVKRLAIEVEDHPVEYGFFEGVIPKGQYGAGVVMLWDSGIWVPLDDSPLLAYEAGHLRFKLDAKKLKGRWDLIRFGKHENQWFLIKYKDSYAKSMTEYSITDKKPNSVVSGDSLPEIARRDEQVPTKKNNRRTLSDEIIKLKVPNKVAKKDFPSYLTPQLVTLVKKPPLEKSWLHEIKLDGYRILAFMNGDDIKLKSRSDKDWSHCFTNIVTDLKRFEFPRAIFDGEVVVLDKSGRSNFQLLQNSIDSENAPFYYYVFDLLYYDCYDLRHLPLIKRKGLLEKIFKSLPDSSLRYNEYILGDAEKVFEEACRLGLEGIVSKKLDDPYVEGRTKSWVKIKCKKQQEFIIGGYSKPQGKRSYFGSLFLGLLNPEGGLDYVGNVGTGFTVRSLQEIHKKLQKFEQAENPFNTLPPNAKNATWVKPLLRAEIAYAEKTENNKLRQPVFKSLCVDIKKGMKSKVSDAFKISNPNKVLYPEDGITKKDILHYYEAISDWILPFILNRPLTLLRCPDGYTTCFYQRHLNKTRLKGLRRVVLKNEPEGYISITDKMGLFNLVQMGVLEIHPWASKVKAINYPDWITFDLDPGTNVAWRKIVETAFHMKSCLEQIDLRSFVKSTGGKGLHVVVPIQAKYTWEEVKHFCESFVESFIQLKPRFYISNMAKSQRSGKIFIDYFRNQRTATAVSVYSTRAKLHAPVSAPLHWDELSSNKADNIFTIDTMINRLRTLKNDPWEDFWISIE